MLDDACLALGLATGITGPRIDALHERFGSVTQIFRAAHDELIAAGIGAAAARSIREPDPALLARCRAWLAGPDQHAVGWADPRYPALLREIPAAPALLFVRGDIDALSLPQLAIVGSRNATPGGLDTATRFAAHLAGAGFGITSGMALGIDAAAHRAALGAGGKTVAVFGAGPDILYPREHAGLADEIAAAGALVSEFPPGTAPRREHFPQRNRIISGLAVGTLVVEAGLRSGALVTARNAAEQGREVFAIPGSIHNPVARGCHRLIRHGAKLVETADDIVEELGGIIASLAATIEQNPDRPTEQPAPTLDSDYRRLLEMMGWDPVDIDTLMKRTGLTTDELSSMLLILELEERVEPLTGGRYVQREEGRSK